MDIIFNHKQTEELLKNGHINSRGQMAFAGGTAFADGSVKRNKRVTNNSNSNNGSGNGSNEKHTSTDDKKKKNSDTDKNQTDKALENFKKALENIVDWIEVKLSRQTDKIDHYISQAESRLDRKLYGEATKNYQTALSNIYTQINNENRGSKDYKQFAKKQMDRAVSKKLISRKDANYYMERVQDGYIGNKKDIQQFAKGIKNPRNNKKLTEKQAGRLTEMITLYKEWYDKGYEAKKAIEELTEQARDQAKAMKDVTDAWRDAKIELRNTITEFASSGFESTSDTSSSYSNNMLDANISKLNNSINTFKQAVDKVYTDVFDMGKKSNSLAKQASAPLAKATKSAKKAAKKEEKANKKKKKGKKSTTQAKYYDAIKNANTAIKGHKKVSSKDLDIIAEQNPNLHARLIAYNQGIDNYEGELLEAIANYTASQNEILANQDQKYTNNEDAYNNQISLYEKHKVNQTTAAKKNTYLNDEIKTQESITKNAEKRVGYWQDALKTSKKSISSFSTKGLPASVKKQVEAAKKAVSDGKEIPEGTLEKLATYYSKRYIKDPDFILACQAWNRQLEYRREAETAFEIAQETERQENSARALEQVKNFRDEADYNKNSRLGYDAEVKNGGQYTRKAYDDSNAQQTAKAQARISMSEAQGHYADESDYTKQLQMNNRDLQHEFTARESMINTFNKYVEDNPWWVGTPEYYQALDAINDTTNNIDKLKQSSVELANEIKKLKWQKIDDGVDAMKRFNSEVDYYLSLIANEQMFDEDNKGNITKYGVASLDLNVAGYEAARATAEKQADIINEMNRQFKSGELDFTNKENIEKAQAWQEALHDTTLEALKYRQAILDEVRQAYEAQLSYLNKTIDKYKELKNAEKDAYDYQKQISESTKNITNLEKQLAAFEGNTSEEAVARVQKLRADLKEAKQNQSDQQYDKYLSDSQNMLDDLSNNFQEWIGSYMKDSDRVIADAKDVLAYKIDDLGKIDDTAKDTLATLKEFETNLGGTIEASNTPLGKAFETALTSVLKDNDTTAAESLNNIYNVVTKEYEALKPLQEAATNVEAQIQGFENKELTLRDEEAVKKAKADYDALSPEAQKYVAQKYVDQLNTAYSTITQLRKKEDDRLAKQKAEEEAKRAAKDEADRKAAEEAKKKADEEAKKKAAAQEAEEAKQRLADMLAPVSTKGTAVTSAKEQAILDQIENIKNQMRTNRDSYKAAKKSAQKAKLDQQYNDLQIKLNKLYEDLAKIQKASKRSSKSISSILAPVTAKGTAKTYASGSSYIKKNQLAYTQDKGQEVIYRKSDGAMLTPLGKGDKVFTNAMSENLWKLAQMNIPDMINSAMSQPIVQNTNQNVNQSVGDIQFVINLYGVENYDKFKSQLVADTQFQNALQEMTLGAAMGRNSLSKFKYN